MIVETFKAFALDGIDPARIIDRVLSNGTAVPVVSGTPSSTNLIGNYSGGGAINLDYTATNGEIHLIHELICCLKDTGTMDTDAYGNNIALTNGIQILFRRSGADLVDITLNNRIKTNQEWFYNSSHANNNAFGTGDEFITVHLDFKDFYGGPLRLVGSTSDTLRVHLSDNFTGLNVHMFKIRGVKE